MLFKRNDLKIVLELDERKRVVAVMQLLMDVNKRVQPKQQKKSKHNTGTAKKKSNKIRLELIAKSSGLIYYYQSTQFAIS